MTVPVVESIAEGIATGTLVVSKPTGTVEGDLLLAFICTDNAEAGLTPGITASPSGWTEADSLGDANNTHLSVWWIIAGASEPSSYSWSGNANNWVKGGIIRISGADATTPINAIALTSETSTSPTCPSVTTTVADCLLHIAGTTVVRSNTLTLPGGFTQGIWQFSNGGAASSQVGTGYKDQVASGATGTFDFTQNNSGISFLATVAIAPASGSGNSVVDESIALNVTISDSQAASVVFNDSITLSTEISDSPAAQVSLQDSIALALTVSASAASGNIVEEAITLATELSYSQSNTVTMAETVLLSIQSSIDSESQAVMAGLLSLGVTLSQALASLATFQESLTLQIAAALAAAGTEPSTIGDVLRFVSESLKSSRFTNESLKTSRFTNEALEN